MPYRIPDSTWPIYTLEEVKSSTTLAYFNTMVLDLSKGPHPVSGKSLLEFAGKDLKEVMIRVPSHGGNMRATLKAMKPFLVGELEDDE